MTDLTRRKLGLRPCGLRAFVYDDNGVSYANVYELGLELDPNVDNRYVDLDNRTSMLLTKLKNETNFRDHSISSQDNDVLDKFSLINDLVSKEELDIVSGISYLNNLVKIIFSQDEQKHLSYDYLKGKENGNYKCIQLINYASEELRHRHDYHFHPDLDGYNFVYRGNGLEFITKKKARNLIEESDSIDLAVDNQSTKGR